MLPVITSLPPYVLIISTLSAVKNSTFQKSKMAHGHHLDDQKITMSVTV